MSKSDITSGNLLPVIAFIAAFAFLVGIVAFARPATSYGIAEPSPAAAQR